MIIRETHFADFTNYTEVEGTGTTSIFDSTYARSNASSTATWNTLGYHETANRTVNEGDMLWFLGVRSELSGGVQAGMFGVTDTAALSIAANAVNMYFTAGNIQGFNNGAVGDAVAYVATTLLDFRFSFNSPNTLIEWRLSTDTDWTTMGTASKDYVGGGAKAQCNINGDIGTDFDCDRIVWTDSNGLSGGMKQFPGDGNSYGSSFGHVKGAIPIGADIVS